MPELHASSQKSARREMGRHGALTLSLQPCPRRLHAAAASALGEELGPHVLVPDLAGWRRERMPRIRDVRYFTLAPDWVCEVLSRSTAKVDRTEKLPIYADHRVGHVSILGTYNDEARVRAEPFEAFELDLGILWADVVLGEPGAQ
jgi:Uma2 family endonuclease